MQKDVIIRKLKEQGGRITKQRLMLLDIILEENCSCCKEIYYRASQIDPQIGIATIYRMINSLEEIGAIDRRNMYRVDSGCRCNPGNDCIVELDDDTVRKLSVQEWNDVVSEGLKACGLAEGQKVRSVQMGAR